MTSSKRHDKVRHTQNRTKSDTDQAEIEGQITLRPDKFVILVNLEENGEFIRKKFGHDEGKRNKIDLYRIWLRNFIITK